jgi:hypothetical protein
MANPVMFSSRRNGRKVKPYPIFQRAGESTTESAPKPAEYKDVPRSQFADSFNARYPVDKQHVHAALTYWAKPEDRRFYTQEGQDRITKKIVEQALKDGVEVTYNPEYMAGLSETVKTRLKGYPPS